MGLSDVAGAEDEAGNAGFGEDGAVAEKSGADGRFLAGEPRELPNQRQIGIGFHRAAIKRLRLDDIGAKAAGLEESFYFGANAANGFAGEGAAVDLDDAGSGNDVGLGSAANGTDVDGAMTEEGVGFGFLEFRGVLSLDDIDDFGHFVNGVLAALGAGAVGGFALGAEFEPKGAFVGGDDLKAGGFADNGEVGFPTGFDERGGADVVNFLVDEAGKNDFGGGGAASALRDGDEGAKHGGDGAFGVAGAASVEAFTDEARDELVVGAVDGIEMRGEENALADFSGWAEGGDEIGTVGQDVFESDVETGVSGSGGEEVGDFFLAGAGMARGKKSRVDAGEGDEVA